MLIYYIKVVTFHWYPVGQEKSVSFPNMLHVVIGSYSQLPSLMNSQRAAIHLEGNPWNIKGHIADERSPRDICNEEQQVVTTLQICTCQTEVDTCDRYILISTCLVQNQTCSQQHGSQMSSASPLSMATVRNPGWKGTWIHL